MSIKQIAKRHHFLTKAYVGLFSDTGKKDGRIYVSDITNGKKFPAIPDRVAFENGFNKICIEGVASDALEIALSEFEGEAINAIRRTISSGKFPEDNDYSLIINLLCFYAIRNPKLRENFNGSRSNVINMIAELVISKEEIFNHHLG